MNRILFFFICLTILQISSCRIFKKNPKKTIAEKGKSASNKQSLLEKYSVLLGEEVENESLYGFVDSWIGVPYKFGGKSKSGVDCSNFSCELLRRVYSFPKDYYYSSSKMAEQGTKISMSKIREGDVLCFSINQNSKISHIGIYLANNKFVHASTSSGVMISSLDEDYYKKRFSFAVRLKK